MSKRTVLVTGATGLVGYGIANACLTRGDHVRALVRNVEQARRILPADVELVQGDVVEPTSLAPAARGAELVFHAAGMPEQWQRDDSIFDRVNREGTKHVLAASLAAGVRRVVYTSTMDVFAAPPGGVLCETNLDPEPKHTAYERSKQAAEREAAAIAKQGLEVVYVNPASVYGPSHNTKGHARARQGGVDTALNGFILRVLRNQVPLLPPGGMPVVFVDGVVHVHLAAADVGRPGERYLVGDAHLSTRQIAEHTLAAARSNRSVPRTGPLWLLKLLANGSAPLARLFGFRPLIAPGELTFLQWNVSVDAGRAAHELGFRPTSVDEGFRRTVEHLLDTSGDSQAT